MRTLVGAIQQLYHTKDYIRACVNAVVQWVVTSVVGVVLVGVVWVLTMEWRVFDSYESVGLSTGSELVFVLSITLCCARVLPTAAYIVLKFSAELLFNGEERNERLFGLFLSISIATLAITVVVLILAEPVFDLLFAIIVNRGGAAGGNAGGNFYEAINIALLTVALTELPRLIYRVTKEEYKRSQQKM